MCETHRDDVALESVGGVSTLYDSAELGVSHTGLDACGTHRSWRAHTHTHTFHRVAGRYQGSLKKRLSIAAYRPDILFPL